MHSTKYSVLMSIYAKENPCYFESAANSMLNQTMQPDEFVLVCDGPLSSELESKIELLMQNNVCPVRIVRLPACKGLGNALRLGTQQCSCEIVARMDSDDVAASDRMEKQISYLEAHPEIDVLGGQIAEFEVSPEDISAYRRVPCNYSDIVKFAAERNPMNHMTVAFRRDAVLEAGNYRVFDRFEDYDLWARMLAKGSRFENLDSVLVFARIDENTYRRRGGITYFYQTIQMQKVLCMAGIINSLGFVKNIAIRFVGTILLPSSIRARIYHRRLRSEI